MMNPMNMGVDMMKSGMSKAGMGKKAKLGKKAAKKSRKKAMIEAREKKRSVPDPGKVVGTAQTAQPVKVMKHGGVVHKTPSTADRLSRHHNRYKIS